MFIFPRANLVLTICALAGITCAQAPPPVPKFAVEIPGDKGFPPSYVTLTSDRVSSLFYDLRRAPGGDPNRRQPTALKLDYQVEGESVRIAASVFFGAFDRQDTPRSLDTLPRTSVGTYSAGLNQSVTLAEMETFGLEPVLLKIVPAQATGSVRPRTFSKAPSIQMEITGDDRTFYKVGLQNLSAKAVAAVRVDMPGNGGAQGQTEHGGFDDLIAPGATFQMRIGIPRGGTVINGSLVENPPSLLMVLEAALFADGTYEGDVTAAAELGAQRIAAGVQRQRIGQVVAAILADAQSDDDTRVTRIRSEVGQLAEDPDARMVEGVQAQFPGLPDEALQQVKLVLKLGLNHGKQSVMLGLEEFVRIKTTSRGLTFAAWWNMWSGMQRATPRIAP